MEPIHTKYDSAETFVFSNAITLKILLKGDHTGGQSAVFEDIVEAGIGPPRHIHKHQDETFFFLEGTFDVEIDGKLYHMQPGDVAFIPRGTPHAFKNVGNQKGRLRYVFSPALTIESMFREFHESATNGTLDDKAMAKIASTHGQETVGPPL